LVRHFFGCFSEIGCFWLEAGKNPADETNTTKSYFFKKHCFFEAAGLAFPAASILLFRDWLPPLKI
jgi:hypothetical protein